MRRLLFIFSFIVFSGLLFAEKIEEKNAVNFAQQIIAERVNDFYFHGYEVYPVSYEHEVVYYVIQFMPQGWVLVAADDKAYPLLGYSDIGVFEREKQPDANRYWLSNYSKEIIEIKKDKSLSKNIAWDKSSYQTRSSNVDRIEPLLSIRWNQNSPYNQFCPIAAGGPGGRAYAGCVATAMSQAIYNTQAPERPKGTKSYRMRTSGQTLTLDFNNEAAYDWSKINSGNLTEIARLMYHCGVAVSMDYTATGSGAYNSDVRAALIDYFGFPSTVSFSKRYSDKNQWTNLLINDLASGNVIVYGGYDPVGPYGHSFNLDGWDGYGSFHVNWGWGGANNGWYPIDGLKDGSHGYTEGHDAVTGIFLSSGTGGNYGPVDITLSGNKVHAQKPTGTYVGDIAVKSQASAPVYTYTLKGQYNFWTQEYADPAFYIENDSLKTSKVFDLQMDGDECDITIKATNKANKKSIEKTFSVKILEPTSVEKVEEWSLVIYPTPADKLLNVRSKNNYKEYRVYALSGRVVSCGILDASQVILLKGIPDGAYVLKLISEYNEVSRAFTIQH